MINWMRNFCLLTIFLIVLILCEFPSECRKAGRRGRGRTRKVVQMFSSMGTKRKEFMNNTDVSTASIETLPLQLI